MIRKVLLLAVAALQMTAGGLASASAASPSLPGTPMPYRSMSFNGELKEEPLDVELVRLGARLGFNDVTFQGGSDVLAQCGRLRAAFDRFGYGKLLKELGLTTSVWVHELSGYDPKLHGPLSASNEALFEHIRRRYEKALGEVFPELGHLVLTVSESEVWVAHEAEFLDRLVETIRRVCAARGKKLILRTFVWHPAQQQGIIETARRLHPDVILQTKCVPQDWSPRNIHDPLIGAFPGRTQLVEIDLWGENAGLHYVANCRLSELKRQYEHWVAKGVQGIAARVMRRAPRLGATESAANTRADSIYGNAQEAGLWFLGAALSGGSSDPDEALRRFTAYRFGPGLAEPMAAVLRSTGEVVDEAQCVGPFTFGRQEPLSGITRSYPAVSSPQGNTYVAEDGALLTREEANARNGGDRYRHLRVAQRYDDADDLLSRNPFHLNWAAFRWDARYAPQYRQTRKGDPAILRMKADGYRDALARADASLEGLERLKDRLPEGAHAYYLWKLQENRYYLIVRSELALAWLRAERKLYTDSDAERMRLLPEIEAHLARIESYHREHAAENYSGSWLERDRRFLRGAALDAPGSVSEFRRFWSIAPPTYPGAGQRQ